jgi:hypothetical protein
MEDLYDALALLCSYCGSQPHLAANAQAAALVAQVRNECAATAAPSLIWLPTHRLLLWLPR